MSRAPSSLLRTHLVPLLLTASVTLASSVALKPIVCFPAPGLVDGDTVRCGTVTVPMGGNSRASAVQLHVTIVGYKVEGAKQAVFHIPGGPGASAESYAPILASTYLPLSDAVGKPVVFVDQRGTGRSTPFLECVDSVNNMSGCLDAWRTADIDALAFTTPHAADDIAAVADAMSLTSIDLWGASYGSRLALEIVRRHGNLVRSVVIESVDAAFSPLRQAPNVRAALDRASTECARSAACSVVVANLSSETDATALELSSNPLDIQFGTLDVNTFLSDVASLMMMARGTSFLPAYVAAVRNRDVPAVQAWRGALSTVPQIAGKFSAAMNMIVNCNDLAPFDPVRMVDGLKISDTDLLGKLVAAQTLEQYSTSCAGWPINPSMPTEPVSSRVPALVLNGAIDSNTPLENAELAASTLASSTVVAFPSTGHFVAHRGANGANPCAASIVAAFILDPTAAVDRSCVAAPRTVAILPAPATMTFKPVPIDSVGFSADVPDGWVTFDEASWYTVGGVLQFRQYPNTKVADVVVGLGDTGLVDSASATTTTVGGNPWTQLSGPGGVTALLIQRDTSVLNILVVVTDGDTVAFAKRVVGSITPQGVVNTAQGTAGTTAPSTPVATIVKPGAATTANAPKAAAPSTAAPFLVSSGAKCPMPSESRLRLRLGVLVPFLLLSLRAHGPL
jgi:pimeloyl-ACP methyl ester carboxylesterase